MQKVKASQISSKDIVEFGSSNYLVVKTEKKFLDGIHLVYLTIQSIKYKSQIGPIGFRSDEKINLIESIAKTHNHHRTKIFV